MSDYFEFTTKILQSNADDKTPVALYANLRLMFSESLLLECVEAQHGDLARSYLCADPILKFKIENNQATIEHLGRKIKKINLEKPQDTIDAFQSFQDSLKVHDFNSDFGGLFGFVGFSAIPFLEDLQFFRQTLENEEIPALSLALYRYVLRFDHYHHTLTTIQLIDQSPNTISLDELLIKISARRAPIFPFSCKGEEIAEMSDADFADLVRICQQHIQRGDVFQIVPSRKFFQKYTGDEFQVYRALRRINPSPFLFFYDYGSFALFGSSPEAQLIINENLATIHPIAGTYPRGQDQMADLEQAEKLKNDAKETAEHVMLVDLARNDLGKNCSDIKVEKFKTVEFYSHVIHLVSTVTGKTERSKSAFQIFADTFPAGTLSGAPKYRAMQILDQNERSPRSFYGGSVGFFGLDGKSCTQAIMIRSFLAKNRELLFQAGAGIVSKSVPETETAEVRNKLAALRRAIEAAEAQSKE